MQGDESFYLHSCSGDGMRRRAPGKDVGQHLTFLLAESRFSSGNVGVVQVGQLPTDRY